VPLTLCRRHRGYQIVDDIALDALVDQVAHLTVRELVLAIGHASQSTLLQVVVEASGLLLIVHVTLVDEMVLVQLVLIFWDFTC
jgi:hypothetical protein